MKNGILKRRLTHIAGSASAVILLGGMLTSCKDDLLTGMPDWLGSSIYEELESRGNFTQTLKLINDLDEETGSGYAKMLGLTGSKTVFAADDDSWAEFYKNNSWGVKSYDELSLAQKKLLFKSNMINSAYLVELLGNIPAESSTTDPIEGACMRRHSSVDISDSIPIITKDMYPVVNEKRVDKEGKQIDWWSEVRDRDSLMIFMDNSVATMIHFMPKFMQNNRITDDDVEFMTNGGIKTNADAFVNGKVVKEADVTCQNGYIHVTDGVPVPMDNMANVIAGNPNFSMYNRLLDRFSYPYYDLTLSARYGDGDSVFIKRYFNEGNGAQTDNHALDQTRDGKKANEKLPYDPGWNELYRYSASGNTYQHDGAMMLVPTDDAMKSYLDNDGSDLKERYGTAAANGYDALDNAPDNVILPLMQNTMHWSLKLAIPSTFNNIKNTASEDMEVSKSDINYVHWASNGVIYETNKVYVAPEYVSVYYPCIIRGDADLSVMYSTIYNDGLTSNSNSEGFRAYLINMPVKKNPQTGVEIPISDRNLYSFIIPTNNALAHYYDPVSYKRTNTDRTLGEVSTACAYVFKVNNKGFVDADAYKVDWNNLDEKGRGYIDLEDKLTSPAPVAETGSSKGSVFNHMKDIINSSLALSLFEYPQKFYQSKAGGPIIVDWSEETDANGEHKVTGLAGSFQYERGYYVPVTEEFNKSREGNGRSYVVEEEPLMSTTLSPYSAITDANRPEFQAFASLLEGCKFISSDDGASHVSMDKALSILNNYHYTIYVPTSSSIEALIAAHKLPISDDRDLISNAVAGLEEYIDELANQVEKDMYDDNNDTIFSVWEQYVAERDAAKAELAFILHEDTVMTEVMENFVSYHIQDNAIYIDGEEHSAAKDNNVYESACLDTATTRYAKIYVDYTPGGQMTLTDNNGGKHHVDPNVNNILTRQYYFNGSSLSNNSCTEIFSSAYAVIHLIDTPMMPFKDGDPKHADNGYYNPATYAKVMDIVNKYYTEPAQEENPGGATPSPVKRHKR